VAPDAKRILPGQKAGKVLEKTVPESQGIAPHAWKHRFPLFRPFLDVPADGTEDRDRPSMSSKSTSSRTAPDRGEELDETDRIDDAPFHEIEIVGDVFLRNVVSLEGLTKMGNDEPPHLVRADDAHFPASNVL
jgi:hypothetical protein